MPQRSAKISIVGTGSIGTTVAYSLLLRHPGLELQLWNRDGRKAGARAFDLSHTGPSTEGGSIRSGSLEDTSGSDIVVLSSGVLPKEDGLRTDVLRDNVEVFRELVPALAQRSGRAVFIVVTNPIDAMAYAACRLAGLPPAQILGSGTVLDCQRLGGFMAESLGLEASRIEARVVGEHGDTMVPLWSQVSYEGRPLGDHLLENGLVLDNQAKRSILERTRRAGWDIRQAGEHSCYGISYSVLRIIESILGYSRAPLTVSSLLSGERGYRGLCMSLPFMLDRGGRGEPLALVTSDEEEAALSLSAQALKAQMLAVDKLLGQC